MFGTAHSRVLHSSSSQNQTEQCIVVSTEPELVCPHLPSCMRPILVIMKAEEDIPCLRGGVLGSAGDDAGSPRCGVPISPSVPGLAVVWEIKGKAKVTSLYPAPPEEKSTDTKRGLC